ncbi:lipoprotein, putative, partial [uncultured Gammaproteobacteria bacterium]
MYTSSHTSKFFNRVLLVTAFLTALFTTVHAADINLALGKSATQSSTLSYHDILPVAGYAVDGNTDGYFLNKSTTYTKYEQGAWWQVDLGGAKNINQIIIYNRTDCCADRLSNYRVSISNKADFSTHIYQQDFHDTPKPKKSIKLSAQSKQGRYVRIQLLDKNYLSLAEVQVMGVNILNSLRFPEVDTSSARNDFSGLYNAPSYPNSSAFATLKDDGSIVVWGDSRHGGIDAPTGSGYTKIYSTEYAFAALKADGSITVWGDSDRGGSNAPVGSGYTKIYSTGSAFAALKADGSITAWGDSNYGGSGAPAGSGYTKIYSTGSAFATLKTDGSIVAWGDSNYGGSDAPTDKGYTKIYSNDLSFAALKADGSITAWGYYSRSGYTGAPTDSGYTKIYSTDAAFAALKADGSITAWGDSGFGGAGAPTGSGYTKIYSTESAFAALKADGSITAWGFETNKDLSAPTDGGYTKIYSNSVAFAALKADGSITAWGMVSNDADWGSTGAPVDKGYTKIYSNSVAFAALKADGSITAWGNSSSGGTGAPTDSGYIKIYSTSAAFVALKADGSITAWGDSGFGGISPIHATNINLALGKPATQSSTFPYHSILPVAGYAVDGNTDGYFLNKSTTHTKYEQGAWWQVDLGEEKNINQIIIYNRTDCCADRLSNYRVSISNKADFSTHTYQQDFHGAPNPKKSIELGANDKKGRYVRIQLLDDYYLSLAEVQVMGVNILNSLRFPEVDYSSARNDFGGLYNAPSYPNSSAFATLQTDGSITAWGDSDSGGLGAPAGSGYTKVYSNYSTFVALKADGSITAWDDSNRGGIDAPTDKNYIEIYSTATAFAALKADGSITAWGDSGSGGSDAPAGSGYTKIYSTFGAF